MVPCDISGANINASAPRAQLSSPAQKMCALLVHAMLTLISTCFLPAPCVIFVYCGQDNSPSVCRPHTQPCFAISFAASITPALPAFRVGSAAAVEVTADIIGHLLHSFCSPEPFFLQWVCVYVFVIIFCWGSQLSLPVITTHGLRAILINLLLN